MYRGYKTLEEVPIRLLVEWRKAANKNGGFLLVPRGEDLYVEDIEAELTRREEDRRSRMARTKISGTLLGKRRPVDV